MHVCQGIGEPLWRVVCYRRGESLHNLVSYESAVDVGDQGVVQGRAWPKHGKVVMAGMSSQPLIWVAWMFVSGGRVPIVRDIVIVLAGKTRPISEDIRRSM